MFYCDKEKMKYRWYKKNETSVQCSSEFYLSRLVCVKIAKLPIGVSALIKNGIVTNAADNICSFHLTALDCNKKEI